MAADMSDRLMAGQEGLEDGIAGQDTMKHIINMEGDVGGN